MGFGHRNAIAIVMVGVFGFLLGSFGINSANNDNSLQTESVLAVGHLQLILKDTDGNIKQYLQTDNLIVNEGANTMADLIFSGLGPALNLNANATDGKFGFIGIGGVSSPETKDNTALLSPVTGCFRNSTFVSGNGASGSGAEIFLDTIFTGFDGCSGTFGEAVLANSLTGGEILSRITFTPSIVIGSTDVLNVFWDITLG